MTVSKATQPGKCLCTDISGTYKVNLGNSRNIQWANWHGQKSPIAGLKDFNVEGDTDIVDIPIEDDRQDEDVVLVVPPALQDTVLNKFVPLVKQNRFQLSEAMGIHMMRSVKMLRRKQNQNENCNYQMVGKKSLVNVLLGEAYNLMRRTKNQLKR